MNDSDAEEGPDRPGDAPSPEQGPADAGAGSRKPATYDSDEEGADIDEDPALRRARAALRVSSVNDECIAGPMDAVSVDQLLRLRFSTPNHMPKSPRQQQQFRVLMEFATGKLADALHECRDASAEHHSKGGGSAYRCRMADQTALRAYKFLYLLPAMAFSYQQGLDTGIGEPQVGPATRLQSISDGRIGDLLTAVLAAAEELPAQRPPADEPTEAGAEWTEADARLQKAAAAVSGKRNGIGIAARRLEQQAGSSPLNERTLNILTSKHPAPGSRPEVSDTAHDTVRQLVAEARARTGMIAPVPPPASEVRRRLAERDKKRAQQGGGSKTSASGRGQDADAGFLPANNEFQPLKVSAEELLVVLRHAGAAKAAGLDGLRYEHLWMATG